MRDSVIVSAVRTPTGKFLGALKAFTATQLGALVVAEAVRRAGIDPQIVDECIMGNVVSAGLGQNPARQAALNGGLPDHVAALTVPVRRRLLYIEQKAREVLAQSHVAPHEEEALLERGAFARFVVGCVDRET